jgi:hypothetical protein
MMTLWNPYLASDLMAITNEPLEPNEILNHQTYLQIMNKIYVNKCKHDDEKIQSSHNL